MRVAWALVALQAVALALGLFGILVALPHPQAFAGNAFALAFFGAALDGTGGATLAIGAAAMFAYGGSAFGLRRTALFFVCASTISAAAELTGTATGWPFGGYAYTSFLGPKLLGRVPFAIPLSWFFMGFAAFALADAIAAQRGWGHRARWSILLGTWLLVAWDLVLDPSMAAPQMQYVHFWVWHEHGRYFGMPLRNLAGWFGTGLCFIGLARRSWRGVPPTRSVALPYVVYALNVGWSMAIALAAGLWPAALIAAFLGLLPASWALVPGRTAARAVET